MVKDLQKNFGNVYASQIISGVCEHNGIATSEKILPSPGRPEKSLPDSDGRFPEYAEQAKALGFQHKRGILVPNNEFHEFCVRNKIQPVKFRRWLYQNGYIDCWSCKNRNLEYAVPVWHDGSTKRFVIFT